MLGMLVISVYSVKFDLMTHLKTPVIIFDGDCTLCNGVVSWVIKQTPKNAFVFVPFRSKYGQDLLKTYQFPLHQLETVILVKDGQVFTYSDGFLKIIALIPNYKYLSSVLSMVPRVIRDTVYKTAAKNRVKWFGQSTTCTVPLHKA